MGTTEECELVRDGNGRIVCDACGRPQAASITTADDGRVVVIRLDAYNYCPNCGRRISNPTYGEFMDGGRK